MPGADAEHPAGQPKGRHRRRWVGGRSKAPARRQFRKLQHMDALARIDAIRHGITMASAELILEEFLLNSEEVRELLRIPTRAFRGDVEEDAVLSPEASERVLGVTKLVSQVEAIVEQSGTIRDFDAVGWVSRWIGEPLPALGGRRPLDFLDTMEGQSLLSGLLAQIQSGAYA